MAVPTGATGAAISITATAHDGGAALTLPPMGAGRIDLDVTSFREYGPHVIDITCRFDGGVAGGPLFVELISDGQMNDAAAIPAKREFSSDGAADTWGYVALSPFQAGYRYRLAASGGSPPPAWSAVQSPFSPLIIIAPAAASITNAGADAPMTALQSTFTLNH